MVPASASWAGIAAGSTVRRNVRRREQVPTRCSGSDLPRRATSHATGISQSHSLLVRPMQTFRLAAAYALIFALAVSAPAAPVAAQSPTAATAPGASEPAERTLGRTEAPAAPAGPTAATTALPVTALPQAATPASQAAEPTAGPAQGAVRSAATIGRMQRDLSPWSMFLSADILVKTVMIGLGFASLATWTIFFAKTIQLSRARRRLRLALKRVADARSLGEAQLALGATRSVVASLLAAAMQELRFSHEDTDEAGIKERAASRFAE